MLQGFQKSLLKGIDPKTLLYIIHIMYLIVNLLLSYLGSIDTDDAISIPCGVIVVGDADGTLTGRDPVLLGLWIYLEHMGLRCEDGLFPVKRQNKYIISTKDQFEERSPSLIFYKFSISLPFHYKN